MGVDTAVLCLRETGEGPKLSPSSDTEVLHKQEIEIEARLSTLQLSVRDMPSNTQRAFWQSLKDTETRRERKPN